MAENITSNDKRKQDFDDLQHEMSGIDNGRMKRFLPESSLSFHAKRKEKEQREFHSRLMQMLQDPIYKAHYDFALDRLGEAERSTDTALAKLEFAIEHAEQELQSIKENAARLPDGTRVYRDAQGDVRREDGSAVEDSLIDSIVWQGNEPSYEAFLEAQQKLTDMKQQYEDTNVYRNEVLGNARDRLEDEDNPPSVDEIDAILDDIETNMPKAVQKELPVPEAVQPESTTSIELPSLGAKP